MSEEEIDITLKPSKGDNIPVTVNPSKTVLEIKQAIATKCGIPADEQRLIFKGQLLKDENTLQSYGPSSGVVIHLVRGRSQTAQQADSTPAPPVTQPAPNPSPTPGPALANNPFAAFAQAPGLQANAGAGANPFVQQMMAAMAGGAGQPGGLGAGAGMFGLDPAMMQQMMNNPMMQQMMQQLLANPQLMQQMMQSPMVQQALANHPMLQGLGANPQMMQQMMDPQYLQMVAQLMGGAAAPAAPGALPGALPANPNPGLGAFGGVGPFGALGGFGAPVGLPPPNARELYASQLQQMREMGFPNDEANLAALHSCGGSVTMAVDRLLQAP